MNYVRKAMTERIIKNGESLTLEVCIDKIPVTGPKVRFIQSNGEVLDVTAYVGETLLSVARRYDIDLEGACEGSLACSTCHIILDPQWYEKLLPASCDEDDMLDLAYGLTPYSRLGCQIIMTEDLDGIIVTIPKQTRHIEF